MDSILSKTGFQPGGRPPAAVEVAPEGVLAGALPGPGQTPVYAFQTLPDGALMPGIGEPNLRRRRLWRRRSVQPLTRSRRAPTL